MEDTNKIMKISYSFGIVDLFHYGHLLALERASDKADYRVFGLLTDAVAKSWIGNVVSTEAKRKAVISSNRLVDHVMMQDSLDPTDNIKWLHTKYPKAKITLYHGNDISIFPAVEYLHKIGGEVQIFDYYESLSPRNIMNTLSQKEQNIQKYSNMLSTKANTLKALASRLVTSHIEDMAIITIEEVQTDPDSVYQKIWEQYQGIRIVIRSSSKREDSFEMSNAGHFESFLDIDSSDKNKVLETINQVIESYKKDGELIPDDQILVQSMTENVTVGGVLFSRDIQHNRPYYVINYDDNGTTNSVTSGQAVKTIWIAHDTKMEQIPEEWQNLMISVHEIESIFKDILLDIEFSIKKSGEIVIFQVRPLAASYRLGNQDQDVEMLELKNKLKSEYATLLSFDQPVFSDMAFWNPAEIIGCNPHPLDYSLYKNIITKQAWNQGLTEIGYKRVSHNLMYRFGNKPYISVDFSFKSLIPETIDEVLTQKLIFYYRNQLKANPSAHDKIEFEIVFSCFDFFTNSRLDKLSNYGFEQNEIVNIRNALFILTDKLIVNYKNILEQDLSDLKKLEAKRNFSEVVMEDPRSDEKFYIEQINELLKATEKYGTIQFSRQARCAFIAKSLCKSLTELGCISKDEYEKIMSCISTVAEQFNQDLTRFASGELSRKYMIKEYGHLRAGTYDIRIPRYDSTDFLDDIENPEKKIKNSASKTIDILLTERVKNAIAQAGFHFCAEDLEFFIRSSIEQREYFKFIFTKSLSRCIELVAELGNRLDIKREELSYVEITQILSLTHYDNAREMREFLFTVIAEHQKLYHRNLGLILPECIFNEDDFDIVTLNNSRPNFITNKKTEAELVIIENVKNIDISHKIAVIEKADPGYDWIFTKNIAGLITKYGGAASHMAIRCAEFGIPAAIGCGEKIYQAICNKHRVTIDCENNSLIY